jgi:subtilase family serine protease
MQPIVAHDDPSRSYADSVRRTERRAYRREATSSRNRVAASGERAVIPPRGGPRRADLPASDPLVLAAGGTTLTASRTTGAYINERAWDLPFGDPGSQFQGSGGGISRLYTRPSYQGRVPGLGADRGVPDVAAASAPDSLAVVISTGHGKYSVEGHGGTSASAPLWAALIALADQHAGRHLGFVNAALYRIAQTGRYHHAFHDVTAGSNTARFPPRTITGYHARAGWDAVSGWGSPNANVLVPLLARTVLSHDAQGL